MGLPFFNEGIPQKHSVIHDAKKVSLSGILQFAFQTKDGKSEGCSINRRKYIATLRLYPARRRD